MTWLRQDHPEVAPVVTGCRGRACGAKPFLLGLPLGFASTSADSARLPSRWSNGRTSLPIGSIDRRHTSARQLPPQRVRSTSETACGAKLSTSFPLTSQGGFAPLWIPQDKDRPEAWSAFGRLASPSLSDDVSRLMSWPPTPTSCSSEGRSGGSGGRAPWPLTRSSEELRSSEVRSQHPVGVRPVRPRGVDEGQSGALPEDTPRGSTGPVRPLTTGTSYPPFGFVRDVGPRPKGWLGQPLLGRGTTSPSLVVVVVVPPKGYYDYVRATLPSVGAQSPGQRSCP